MEVGKLPRGFHSSTSSISSNFNLGKSSSYKLSGARLCQIAFVARHQNTWDNGIAQNLPTYLPLLFNRKPFWQKHLNDPSELIHFPLSQTSALSSHSLMSVRKPDANRNKYFLLFLCHRKIFLIYRSSVCRSGGILCDNNTSLPSRSLVWCIIARIF